MKLIYKYITVLILIITFASCEEESNFQESDIALTPVYSLTEITGNNAAFKINIYKQKNIITEYSTKFNLKSFTSSGFSDTSDATNYQVSVSKMEDGNTINYAITADKTTGNGTLTVDGTTSYSIVLEDTEVYN